MWTVRCGGSAVRVLNTSVTIHMAGYAPVRYDYAPGGSARVGDMKDRMLRGEMYRLDDPDLRADLDRCAELVSAYNDTRGSDRAARPGILAKLLGGVGERTI